MSCLSCVDSQGRSVSWILMERTGIIVSKPYLITSVSSDSFPSHDLSDVSKLDQGIPIKNRPTLLTLLGRLSLDLMILRFGFEASRVDSCSWNGAHYILRPNKWFIRFVWLEISETSSSTLHPHECYSNTDTHWQIARALRISFRKCIDMFLLRDLRNMGTSIGIKKAIFNLKMAYIEGKADEPKLIP